LKKNTVDIYPKSSCTGRVSLKGIYQKKISGEFPVIWSMELVSRGIKGRFSAYANKNSSFSCFSS
jgi:hypothetical protein